MTELATKYDWAKRSFRWIPTAVLAVLVLGSFPGSYAQGTETTGSAPPVVAPAQEKPVAEKPVTAPVTEKAKPQSADVTPAVRPPLDRFGYSFFAEARKLVFQRQRENPAPPTDPTATPVGPNDLVRGNMTTVPARYQLGPGDRLTIRITSPVQAASETEAKLDTTGSILVPGTNRKVVLRGQTLAQAEKLVSRVAARFVRDAKAEIQLAAVRSITIRVLGEAFAPGTYEVPSIISVFNALYAAGGPSDFGSLRTIELRRANGATKTIDLYGYFLKGDASGDIGLQPGDLLLIPPAVSQVSVRGEVRRPAIFELKTGETLKQALKFAGGVRPAGISQRVSVESIRPGNSRFLADVNLGAKDGNPVLYDGDNVEVFSVRPVLANVVTIQGPVDQPRTYALRPGMRVSDLIDTARGLLPEAALDRADLFRKTALGEDVLIPVNLREAVQKSAANPLLKEGDRLKIYTIGELAFLSPRRLSVAGAVQRPGSYRRADGMTLRDLLVQVGGLLPTANDRMGFIQRTLPDGTPGELIKVDLGKALNGDKTANVLLQDDDVLTVNTFAESAFTAEQSVEISGAVLRQGTYTRSKGMRVADLIAVVGGLKPNASTERAYLQRVNADGTQGPLLILDLSKVLSGDPSQNVELSPKDKLSVFTQEETAFRVDETIRVIGAVQRPGTFRRASNMTLKDAISFAGGVFPNAAETLELTRAWSEVGAPVLRINLHDVMAGVPTANVTLLPGDTITLPTRTDLIEKPRIVQILGAVKYPGPYMLTGRNDRLSNLVQRSGGLTDRAFTPGAEFVRDPKFLTTARQLALQPRLAAAFRLVSEDEFKRAQALIDLDRLRIVFSQGTSISGSAPLLTNQPAPSGQGGLSIQPGKSLDQALAEALRSEAATAARVLGERELIPSGNLNVNVETALRQPGGRTDVILQDGDTVIIPERPTTVAISGAVALPSAVSFAPGESLAYYLDRAGGTSADAAVDLIIVVRASGTIVKYRRGVKIELGDHILVPTKVMAVRLREKVSDLQSAASGLASAGLTLALIRALSK